MPRKARQEIIAPHTLYHIVSRGNNQQKIFRETRDYKKFLTIFERVKKEFPFYLYSYNLLPNHYHLEVEMHTISISKIMHRTNFLYARYFHNRHKTSGHLFQDRFYSSPIDQEIYFWKVSSYIDLNAVRAGLVKRPEDYLWSSYSIYCQKDYEGELIDRGKFLKYYGGDDLEKSRLSYLKFVEEESKSKKEPEFIKNKWFI